MSSNIALIVVFNHNYEKNLPLLREIYKNRFSNIYFLMPFYQGSDNDVVSVSYPSNCFQGYLAQAYEKLKGFDYDHWLVIGDDLILNPSVNQENVKEVLNVGPNDCFIPTLNKFHDKLVWRHSRRYLDFNIRSKFVEIAPQLPKREDCASRLAAYGVEPSGLSYENVYIAPYPELKTEDERIAIFGRRYLSDREKFFNETGLLHGDYPACFGYSDILMLSRGSLDQFCHLCSVTAAGGLFVEIAIPTCLVLSTKGVVRTQETSTLKGRALWGKEVESVLDEFDCNFEKLQTHFPSNYLYLHPVKLSKWV
ncbi:MAG: hypothetical protein CMF12_06880 [Idiomarina sp.]|uniref:hypothetical protein n=1 Tax=Idiomarina sp. TaxID=1874361 RepID=UPI000C488E05|nr:hypothetical protein [Idiomarina sp.]MBT42234.1 hypothetical protein [Idiomarina sp.]